MPMISCMVAIVALAVMPELHVVSLYESKVPVGGKDIPVKAQVVVNRPGRDVTLFLSAYEPCTWQVIVGPDTRLTKVILGGYHQQAAEVPKGVEVVELFYEAR